MNTQHLPLIIFISVLLGGCSHVPDHALFKPSEKLPGFLQPDFQQYAVETRQWIEKNRVFLTGEHQAELDANSPYEVKPVTTGHKKRGVLLVHGLGDSPFYFTDISKTLAKQGFLVRTMLLPGHGSRPADLTLPVLSDWQTAVKHHTRLLAQEVDELWLGGFSTGSNLVTSEALNNDDVAGLLLFSPGFQPAHRTTALAPLANWFTDWADIDTHSGNYTRYDALAMNGAALYYRSSREVRDQLTEKPFNKPVLITMSENDSVISAKGVLKLFNERFTNSQSRMIWYGKAPDKVNERLIVFSSQRPEERVSNFAHMSVLFSPDNPFYGKSGQHRICDNGQTDNAEQQCFTADNIWYSAWGYREKGKIHARLTWNPYYQELTRVIAEVTKNH